MATKRYNGEEESLVDQDAADQEATSMRKRAMDEGERDEKAMPAAAAAKPAIVTKEALAKSGLSLRDYLNKQQGLTRRGGGAPTSASTSPSTAKSKPDADYSNEGKGDSKYRKQTMTAESQALEAVHPEQYFMPGGGLKTAANLAKSLANRGAMRTVSQGALPAPTRQIGYDKAGAMAKQRAARAEGRTSEMLSENARRSGVTPGSAAAESLRKNLGGDDFSLGMKRGGSVSSASRRADGIATKGKTRGRMC